MALFNCPECNGLVSHEASTCPHCGKPNPVDQSMIEERRREEAQREAELQRLAKMERQADRTKVLADGDVPKPSGFLKACPILAILCGLFAAGVHAGRVALEKPWWEQMGIAEFLLHAVTGILPFLLAQFLLLLPYLRGKTKILALMGLAASLVGSLLVLTEAFFLMVVESEGDDYWFSEGILSQFCWHGGETLLFVVGPTILVISCLMGRGTRFPLFLCIPFVLLCLGVVLERVVTFQMDDPFGRLPDPDEYNQVIEAPASPVPASGLPDRPPEPEAYVGTEEVLEPQAPTSLIEKILWAADGLCWLPIIILCAVSTMASAKATAAKEN